MRIYNTLKQRLPLVPFWIVLFRFIIILQSKGCLLCHPERRAKPNVCKKCNLLILQQTTISFLELNNTNTVQQRQLRTRKSDAKHRDLYYKNTFYCVFNVLYKNITMSVKKCHLLTLQQTVIYFLKQFNANPFPYGCTARDPTRFASHFFVRVILSGIEIRA